MDKHEHQWQPYGVNYLEQQWDAYSNKYITSSIEHFRACKKCGKVERWNGDIKRWEQRIPGEK